MMLPNDLHFFYKTEGEGTTENEESIEKLMKKWLILTQFQKKIAKIGNKG